MVFSQNEWGFLLQLCVSTWGSYWNRCVAQKCSLVWNYLIDSSRKTSASSKGANPDKLSPHLFGGEESSQWLLLKEQTPLWDQCLENHIDEIFSTRIFLVSGGKMLQLFGGVMISQAVSYLQQDSDHLWKNMLLGIEQRKTPPQKPD